MEDREWLVAELAKIVERQEAIINCLTHVCDALAVLAVEHPGVPVSQLAVRPGGQRAAATLRLVPPTTMMDQLEERWEQAVLTGYLPLAHRKATEAPA